jgi:hypothetical protein
MKLDDSCVTKELTGDLLFLLASFFVSIRISSLPSSDSSSNAPGTAATQIQSGWPPFLPATALTFFA